MLLRPEEERAAPLLGPLEGAPAAPSIVLVPAVPSGRAALQAPLVLIAPPAAAPALFGVAPVPGPALSAPGRSSGVLQFLEDNLFTAAARAERARHVAMYEAFCDQLDPFMRDLPSDEARADRWALFAISLYEQEKREEQVFRVLNGVRQHLLVHGVDLEFLQSAIVGAIRKAVKRTTVEQRTAAIRAVERALLPMSDPALDLLHTEYWTRLPWFAYEHAPLHRLVALAVKFALFSALRVCHYTAAPSKANDHCLKGEDLVLRLQPSGPGAVSDEPVEVRAPDWVLGTPALFVLGLKYFVYTSKTGQAAPTTVATVVLRGDSPEGDLLIDMFVEWLNHESAAPQEGLPLFSTRRRKLAPSKADRAGGPGPYYHKTRKLARTDVASALKWASEGVGLNPAQFSTHSLRKAAATTAFRRGESARLGESAGQWKAGADGRPSRAVRASYAHHLAISSSDGPHMRALSNRNAPTTRGETGAKKGKGKGTSKVGGK